MQSTHDWSLILKEVESLAQNEQVIERLPQVLQIVSQYFEHDKTRNNNNNNNNNNAAPFQPKNDEVVVLIWRLLSIFKLINEGKISVEKFPINEFTTTCRLIVQILNKNQISFSSQQNQMRYEEAIEFLAFPEIPNTRFAERLRALSYLLVDNAKFLKEKQIVRLFDLLMKQGRVNLDQELQRFAINCLGNLIARSGVKTKTPQKIKDVYSMLLEQIQRLSQKLLSDSRPSKLYGAFLRTFQCVIVETKVLTDQDFKLILPILTMFCTYGLARTPEQENSRLKHDDFSDSECSDSENSDRFGLWKVRFHSLLCLGAVAKANSKFFLPHLHQLLGETKISTSPPSPLSAQDQTFQELPLISIALSDPVAKVRGAAISTVASIVEACKLYLMTAQTPQGKVASFTSLSHKVATLIEALHTNLLFVLLKEESEPVSPGMQSHIFKAFSVLAQCCPYDKLQMGLAAPIVQEALVATGLIASSKRNSWENKNTFPTSAASVSSGLRLSAWQCVAAFLGSRAPQVQILEWLSEKKQCDILYKIGDMALSLENDPHVASEILRVLAVCARRGLISTEWEFVPKILATTSQIKHDVHLGAIFIFVEDIVRYGLHQTELWNTLAEHINFCAFLRHKSASIRTAACSSLSFFPLAPFFSVWKTRQQQQELFEALSQIVSRDPVALVKASACKTLGVISGFLSFDPVFVTSCISVLGLSLGRESRNTTVRVKASWALANVAAALESHHPQWTEKLPLTTIHVLLESALQACTESDKVSCNGIRALGLVCSFAPKEIIQQNHNQHQQNHNQHQQNHNQHQQNHNQHQQNHNQYQQNHNQYQQNHNQQQNNKQYHRQKQTIDQQQKSNQYYSQQQGVVSKAIATLAQCAQNGSAKAKWNVARALRNCLGNPELQIQLEQAEGRPLKWRDVLFDTLIKFIQTEKNFKVRIHAAAALSAALRRTQYGPAYVAICKTILSALYQGSNDGPAQYAYNSTLDQQLKFAVAHLLSLASSNDLEVVFFSEKNCSRILADLHNELLALTSKCGNQTFASNQADNSIQILTTKNLQQTLNNNSHNRHNNTSNSHINTMNDITSSQSICLNQNDDDEETDSSNSVSIEEIITKLKLAISHLLQTASEIGFAWDPTRVDISSLL